MSWNKPLNTLALYDRILDYFRIEEFFTEKAVQQWQHKGSYWFLSRLDKRLLEVILWARETIDKPFHANDWFWGGRFDERGYRDIQSDMVKSRSDVWMSAHLMGMALDFVVDGVPATHVRDWFWVNKDQCPHPIRLERNLNGKPISWVHLDVCDDPRNPKVYLFDV